MAGEDGEGRRSALLDVLAEARACERCSLAKTRTKVVFGAGNANAELMFVGEAPGANEDRQGLPFVGAAGKLLESLLGEIGLSRSDVFICNVLKCRPPGNRDPRPEEITACRGFLERQLQLVRPSVVCTLGNFATRLLRDDPAGISRIHGVIERRELGGLSVLLVPTYHPAAALYSRFLEAPLREDFARLAEALDRARRGAESGASPSGPAFGPGSAHALRTRADSAEPGSSTPTSAAEPVQLELF
jgi:uracil-DNA glycosylase family 4